MQEDSEEGLTVLDNFKKEDVIYNDEIDSAGSVDVEDYGDLEKDINSDKILKDIILYFLPITQNEEFDEHDVLSLQNMFPPYYFYETPIIPNASNEFLVQENNQQIQECYDSLKGCEAHEFLKLLQGEKEQPSLIHVARFKYKIDFINQLDFCHGIYDPIIDWMGSCF